ncbi:MAG: hypothetical protein DWQ47_13465 [Acidobacteria bacterium]|nr:MAG: hypothetical protein DWQ32_00865 [Acidobacteriota bacterium]REK02915.1 MAG: hypothetical protein DWQ38_11270 [Acidobacteriota bacterium]REK13281.1 MAG: hypothetical protein DWQ43_06555 [Acidobacteriota bacterium]REK41275.1 MAG: hypothetical protein DWQ47_13465 [Acidobacteriota bacterium]
MRVCPKCQSRYTDETLSFCLQDGAPLVDETDVSPDHPTVAFDADDAETVVSKKGTDRIGIDIPRESTEKETQERLAVSAREVSDQDNKGTVKTVAATAVVMVVIFLVAGAIGLGIYLNRESLFSSSNTSASLPTGTNTESNRENGSRDMSPSPSVSPDATPSPTTSPTPTATSTPDVEPDKIKDVVRGRLNAWKRATESQNLSSVMSFYASRLDRYYTRSRVSRSFVRNDKNRAFGRLDSIAISISNLSVEPGSAGDSAVATFDKEWRFAGGGRISTGKVRSRFDYRLSEGNWLITGERDLKVYYTK